MSDDGVMSDDAIKRLVAEVVATRPQPVVRRSNRTLYLDSRQWGEFAAWCKAHQQKPSEIVDRLIGVFMAEAERLQRRAG